MSLTLLSPSTKFAFSAAPRFQGGFQGAVPAAFTGVQADTVRFSGVTPKADAEAFKHLSFEQLQQETAEGKWFHKQERDVHLFFIAPAGVQAHFPDNDKDEKNVFYYRCAPTKAGKMRSRLYEAHGYDQYKKEPWIYNFILKCLQYKNPETLSNLLISLPPGQNPEDTRILEMGALTGLFGEALREKGYTPNQLIATDITPTVKTVPRDIYTNVYCFKKDAQNPYAKIGNRHHPNTLVACGVLVKADATVELAQALNTLAYQKDHEGYFVFDLIEVNMDSHTEDSPIKKTLELLKQEGCIEYDIVKRGHPLRLKTNGEPRLNIIVKGRKLKPISPETMQQIGQFKADYVELQKQKEQKNIS